MTLGTARCIGELPVDMTRFAIELGMGLIQQKTDYRVPEVGRIPPTVASTAMAIEPGNSLAGWVTTTTANPRVIRLECKAGIGMGKPGLLFRIMTLAAGILAVTIVANCVNLLLGANNFGFLLQVVAIAAGFLLVAVDTAQAKELDMIFMVEGHDRARLVGRRPNPFCRYMNSRVRNTHDIGRVRLQRDRTARLRQVADDTLGIVTPFTMTRQALTMVGPLQVGLAQIG